MKKIVFYGGGNIAQANIKGLISSGIKKQDILYIERNIKNKEILNKIGVKEFSLEKKKKLSPSLVRQLLSQKSSNSHT